MLNTKEYFNRLDATVAIQEVDDELAATCSGGVAAVTLYENGGFNNIKDGRVQRINESTDNLVSFNDLTSSFKISRGSWAFYADENPDKDTEPLFWAGPGNYPVMPSGTNDQITAIKQIA